MEPGHSRHLSGKRKTDCSPQLKASKSKRATTALSCSRGSSKTRKTSALRFIAKQGESVAEQAQEVEARLDLLTERVSALQTRPSGSSMRLEEITTSQQFHGTSVGLCPPHSTQEECLLQTLAAGAKQLLTEDATLKTELGVKLSETWQKSASTRLSVLQLVNATEEFLSSKPTERNSDRKELECTVQDAFDKLTCLEKRVTNQETQLKEAVAKVTRVSDCQRELTACQKEIEDLKQVLINKTSCIEALEKERLNFQETISQLRAQLSHTTSLEPRSRRSVTPSQQVIKTARVNIEELTHGITLHPSTSSHRLDVLAAYLRELHMKHTIEDVSSLAIETIEQLRKEYFQLKEAADPNAKLTKQLTDKVEDLTLANYELLQELKQKSLVLEQLQSQQTNAETQTSLATDEEALQICSKCNRKLSHSRHSGKAHAKIVTTGKVQELHRLLADKEEELKTLRSTMSHKRSKAQLNNQLVPLLKEEIKTLQQKLQDKQAVDLDVLQSSFVQFLATLPPLRGESCTMKHVLMHLLQLSPQRVNRVQFFSKTDR